MLRLDRAVTHNATAVEWATLSFPSLTMLNMSNSRFAWRGLQAMPRLRSLTIGAFDVFSIKLLSESILEELDVPLHGELIELLIAHKPATLARLTLTVSIARPGLQFTAQQWDAISSRLQPARLDVKVILDPGEFNLTNIQALEAVGPRLFAVSHWAIWARQEYPLEIDQPLVTTCCKPSCRASALRFRRSASFG